jgi:zinc/manganese transport system ATP-binding protein
MLWQDLEMHVQPGEFIAVLGPNGAGKTSLLKALLGLLPLEKGTLLIDGQPVHRGDDSIGYIPQQKSFDRDLPIRGRDLVGLGINGSRYGFGGSRHADRQVIDAAINSVEAAHYADKPIGMLSGGEQQRLRIAQALVGQPKLLLCDEPLLSLDMASQQMVTGLIDSYRKTRSAAVIFVTHEINPILQYVDRVLYMARGRWVIDTPEVVLQSKTLSDLYGTSVEVVRIKDRVLVVGAEAEALTGQEYHHEAHA